MAGRFRGWIPVPLALAIGLWLAYVDSRPGFDDTGAMAALLLALSAGFAGVSGQRPWLWALLLGAPIPIAEIPSSGSAAALAAVAITSVGATVGWLIGRAARSTAAA